MKKEYIEPPSIRVVSVNVEKGYAVSQEEENNGKAKKAGTLGIGNNYIWK